MTLPMSCSGVFLDAVEGTVEHVYRFSATQDANYTLTLTSTALAELAVGTACPILATSCETGGTAFESVPLIIILHATAGTSYFAVVEDYADGPSLGSYTLEVSAPWTPENLEGNTCAHPFMIEALPFSYAGDTTNATGEYGYEAGECPGKPTEGWGATSNDEVFAFTPAADGNYTVLLDVQSFDSNLYVVTDCADIATSCVIADEQVGSSADETVTFAGKSGTTYYIIVDGWGTGGTNATGPYTLNVTAAP
jgi:hypothetical protein